MSLPNNHEDWERRKQYLVRSLFDVPSEDRESKDISKSHLPWPLRLSLLRPESPLPPLIIEAMPDKHDDPPEYYRKLEKKLKKVYRKMFLDERSSSPESDKNYDICSLDTDRISQDKEEEVSQNESDSEFNVSHQGHIDVMRRQEIYSPNLGSQSDDRNAKAEVSTSALASPSPIQGCKRKASFEFYEANGEIWTRSDVIAPHSNGEKSERDEEMVDGVAQPIKKYNEDRESKDISKSHLPWPLRLSLLRPESPLPPLIIEAMPDKHDDPPEYYRKLEKKLKKVYRKMFLDERSSSPESDKNYDICSLDTDRISQDKEEEVSQNESDSEFNVSHQGHIDVMRRQEIYSPNLGSQSDDRNAKAEVSTSALASPSPIQGCKRKASFEFYEANGEIWTRSDVIAPHSNGEKSERDEIVDGVAQPIKKYKHVHVQTSREEDEPTLNWNSVKGDFFVGTPKLL